MQLFSYAGKIFNVVILPVTLPICNIIYFAEKAYVGIVSGTSRIIQSVHYPLHTLRRAF